MHGRQVLEIVGRVLVPVGAGGPAQKFDLGIVHLAGQRHLRMAVDERGGRLPDAIPHEEEVAGFWVRSVGALSPGPGSIDIIFDAFPGEGQRIMLIEDHHAVHAVVFGDVAGRDGVLALHPPEDILRGAIQGPAKRVISGLLDHPGEVSGAADLLGPAGAQFVVQRPFPGDDVGHLDDLLRLDRLHRAEIAADPGVHRLGWGQRARHLADVKDAPEAGLVGFVHGLRQVHQVQDFRRDLLRGGGGRVSTLLDV